ncbi:MAG: hypothetical protein COT74_02800 [Bdellovibrionales bacterium CG10_big_fil_rev_8_21_14_0_10_45_34]|nr:MAG: hypothetical protein COT74_02800 [Bdellovibrionales bacterium CG10_big_fil_rev_8_21_14_0_10_45_34]
MEAQNILESVKNEEYSRIQGHFKLTKSEFNFADVLIRRDRELEDAVFSWIEQRTSYRSLIEKYKAYDHELEDFSNPQHFAANVIIGSGSICSGQNIFMFFPQAIGQVAANENEVFGIEFIDIWSNIFTSVIFPIVRRSFGPSTGTRLLSLYNNLDKTIYLASVFHEVGHRVGPYRVSPQLRPNLKINPYFLDVMGEISTDSLLIRHLSEFPEIATFVIMQRLFWFGRLGFKDDPISGQTTIDNDSWIGSLLWNRLTAAGAIFADHGRLEIDFSLFPTIFADLTQEVDSLLSLHKNADDQNQQIDRWMKQQVKYTEGKFQLPDSFRVLLEDLQEIPEIPHFHAPFPYSQMESFIGAIQNGK